MTRDDITLGVLVVAVAVAAAPGLGRSEQALRVETAAAIRELQPRVSEVRADELARVIDEAAARHDIDPLLVVAVVMRESSFRPDVERLQAITEADARAEGVQPAPFCRAGRAAGLEHVESFEAMWDSINAKRGHPWASNCWVWVVEFRRVGQLGGGDD